CASEQQKPCGYCGISEQSNRCGRCWMIRRPHDTCAARQNRLSKKLAARNNCMNDQTIELELTAMAHGGKALGRADKRTVFVPYTIPGERVLARITQDKGRVAFAEGVRLLDASADRVYPRCPHFGPGRCGLCHWQHIDYDAQLLLKQDVLADQLARIGGFEDADVLPVIPSPQVWGYNYHMTMIAGENGQPGYPGVDEGRIILIEECHIIHPDLLELYDRLD